MVLTFVGLAIFAFVIGMTETNEAIGTAVGIILAASLLVAGMDLFSQKSGKATLIDAGYVFASGAVMIVAQGVFYGGVAEWGRRVTWTCGGPFLFLLTFR